MGLVRVSPLNSDSVVEIPEESVDAYVAQGWTRESVEAEKPKRSTRTKNDK